MNAMEPGQVALSFISRHDFIVDAYMWTPSLLPSIKIKLKRCFSNGFSLRLSGLPKNYSICTGVYIGYLRMLCDFLKKGECFEDEESIGTHLSS